MDPWLLMLAALFGAVASVFGYLNNRLNAQTRRLAVVANEKIHEIHVSMNSRLDQLLKSTAAQSHAEGVEAGRAETKPL